MAHADNSITIAKPVNQVFNFILDGMHNPLWRPAVIDIKSISSKPPGVGAVFKQGLKGPGGRIDADYEIVECQPDTLIKFLVITGPARPTGTYMFESQGDHTTKVSFTLHFEPKGLAKLMDGMITKSMQSEVATLSNLKAYLENH
jgi:uncharacterized membrane protein